MKTYSTSALVALIIISFAPLNACKQKKSTFKVPHIPTIYGNNLSKVLAFDEDNGFLTGAFGYAARTTQGSQIRFENSKKNFWVGCCVGKDLLEKYLFLMLLEKKLLKSLM